MSGHAGVPDRPRPRPGTAVAAAGAVLLGSLALVPVFAAGSWLPPVAFAVVAVGLGGVLLRAVLARWALPSALDRLVPLGQAGLALCALTVVFTPDDAWAGVLPTPTSVGDLGGLLLDGAAEIREQATPALPLTGLVALTTVFVALVALAVDLIAVPARQPALGGLGLLVLYCVPVSTITGQVSLIAFMAPATGFALLLWADQRDRLTEGARAGAGSPLGTGTLPALRTGVVALVAGIVLAAFVPTLSEGSLATGLGGGAGGGSTGSALDPVAEMRGDLTLPSPRELFRIDASVQQPGYLRAVVLDQYTDTGWRMSNLDGSESIAEDPTLAPLPGRVASRPVAAEITVVAHEDRFLPSLYSPLSVEVDGPSDNRWRFDEETSTVFGRGVTTAGLSYRVTAQEPEPAIEDLAAAPEVAPGDPVAERFGQLPPLDPSVPALVGELTAPGQTPYERVMAVHRHLTDRANGFRYSLSTAPGTTGDDLADFLRLKQGYCEQYAGAMAVLVRAAGVPARVVLGYTTGSAQEDGTRIVTTDDAHAWVEVWFADLGWVPFDPTPIAAARAVELPWAPRADADTPEAAAPTAPTATGPVPAGPTAQLDRDDQYVPPLALPAAEPADRFAPVLTGGGLTALVLAAGLVPWAVRRHQRRARLDDGRPGALWEELLATATDLGVPAPVTATPRQLARQLAERVADVDRSAVAAVRSLALAEEQSVYGRPTPGAPDPGLRDAVLTLERALGASVPRAQRLRAALWPASTVGAATRWLTAHTPRRLRSA
ncbi:transglutaminase family protein [Modestobacter marinus]|uniref:transglutaminase family protein n=1 Tax=Modestobacter marinus TaxID=477641 RepID=UPI0027DF0D05|nr:DUF3488 and transglutaminase-like domain-containing protein [Modestobacter marinus]